MRKTYAHKQIRMYMLLYTLIIYTYMYIYMYTHIYIRTHIRGLVSRFRSVLPRLLSSNGKESVVLASRCRHLSVFGLPNQARFFGMVKYHSFDYQMYMFCQAILCFAASKVLLNQKPRGHFKPDFSNFSSTSLFCLAASVK